jgi:hypothetical protein
MKTFEIQRPLGVLTITEETINNMIDDLSVLESILLMYKKNADTFENYWEVEFTRADADDFLLNYFLKNSGYDKDYIKSIFTNQPINNL